MILSGHGVEGRSEAGSASVDNDGVVTHSLNRLKSSLRLRGGEPLVGLSIPSYNPPAAVGNLLFWLAAAAAAAAGGGVMLFFSMWLRKILGFSANFFW